MRKSLKLRRCSRLVLGLIWNNNIVEVNAIIVQEAVPTTAISTTIVLFHKNVFDHTSLSDSEPWDSGETRFCTSLWIRLTRGHALRLWPEIASSRSSPKAWFWPQWPLPGSASGKNLKMTKNVISLFRFAWQNWTYFIPYTLIWARFRLTSSNIISSIFRSACRSLHNWG